MQYFAITNEPHFVSDCSKFCPLPIHTSNFSHPNTKVRAARFASRFVHYQCRHYPKIKCFHFPVHLSLRFVRAGTVSVTVSDFTLAEILPEPAVRSPLLAIVLGGVGSLALLLLGAILVTLTRRRGRRQESLPAARSAASTPDTGRGPDIVPSRNGER